MNCPICHGTRVALARALLNEFDPDPEPFESGRYEDLDTIETEVVGVFIHYCGDCQRIVDAWTDWKGASPDGDKKGEHDE